GGQSQSLDASSQPQLQRPARWRWPLQVCLPRVRARLSRPVEHGPEIALEDRPLERIWYQFFPLLRQELVEDRDRLLVRFPLQQVPGLHPEKRVEPVLAIFLAVGSGPNPKCPVQAVPEVLGIGI